MKKVYVGMAADIIHEGHLNIIKEARKRGKVIVGLLTDSAVASYKRLPLLPYHQRELIVKNIKGVDTVIPQETLDYRPNLNKIQPDYVVHGDDWRDGVQVETRSQVIDTLKEWGGELVEPKYTEGISSGELISTLLTNGISPEIRLGQLRRLIQAKPIVTVLEAHNGLTGLIVENSKISVNGEVREFDAMWESSLTDSTAKGKPDIELVDFTSRVKTINEIIEVTTKPIIVDGDTGGQIEHFRYHVKTLERLGVSAVIIEDKIGLKRNSLFGTEVVQEQDTIENFCKKISQGKKSLVNDEFMIIARIESLILKQGLDDAIERAKAYLDAGADGIMIHSREKSGKEIFDFCDTYGGFPNKKPLVVVPSSYAHVTEEQLQERGVKIVIYANHLLRSAYPAMTKVAESILKNKRAQEASQEHCMSIKEVLNIIPKNAA